MLCSRNETELSTDNHIHTHTHTETRWYFVRPVFHASARVRLNKVYAVTTVWNDKNKYEIWRDED